MDVKHDIVSVMGEGVISDSGPGLDLSRATLVGSGGSCDVFRVRWRNRMVCVKRLKPELVADPRLRQALRKEFELGFSLSHRAIPQYIHEGPDYIVMDYVNGENLRSLMSRKDPWLASPENQKRLMAELVDALEYLHGRHITHCDIKTDNVMITECARHAMLIDLGLSHADWLDSTAGDPERFGLKATDYKGNPSVDFRALAIVAEKLGKAGYDIGQLRGFIGCCRRADVTAAELRRSLSSGAGKAWRMRAVGIVAAVSVLAICVFLPIGLADRPAGQGAESGRPLVDMSPSSGEDFKIGIHDQTPGLFKNTERLIEELERKLADGAAGRMTDVEIDSAIRQLVDTYNSEYSDAINVLRSRFPEASDADIEIALCSTVSHAGLVQRRQMVMQSLTEIIMARGGNSVDARR